MTNIKSREEKLEEKFKQYFKNEELVNKLEEVFDKNMVKIIENNVKKIIPDFTEKRASLALEYLKDNNGDPLASSFKEYLCDEYNKISYFLENNEQELIDNIEDKFHNYYKFIQSLLDEMGQIQYNQGQERCFSSICLKNFKGFSANNKEADNTIKIKPITLIYGPNSYGKSSILQALLLLFQTVTEEFDYKNVTLKPNGEFVSLGTFDDFVNKNAKEKEFKIELTLPYRIYSSNENMITEMSIGYNFSTKNSQIILHRINVSKKDKNLNPAIKSNPWKIPIYEFYQSDSDSNAYDIYEYGTSSGTTVKKDSFFTIEDFPNDVTGDDNITQDAEDVIKNILYISSFRNPPKRYYVPEDSIRKYVGKNGENTREILESDKHVCEKVSFWLKKIAGYTLSTGDKKDKKGKIFSSVNLDDTTTKIKNINLIDLGSGVAQVLPIITQAFITPDRKSTIESVIIGKHNLYIDAEQNKGNMVLIEEPEIHLHPKAQAELGAMFADAIKETNNTFIIETHSENLLLRLQKLIRQGKLSKDDVSVVYVDKNIDGSHCIPLEIKDNGYIDNTEKINEGFFEEGFNEMFGN